MNTLLKEIAENWKLEAKQEDNNRYFCHIDETEKIMSGDRFYVIGRKGSGKSAIGQYILSLNKADTEHYDVFSVKLSFKNFPFNDLYALDNSKYTRPNQYITIWKYIIYSSICRLMVQNQNLKAEVRKVLEKLYPPDPIKNLARSIESWTTKEFGAQIAGIGGNIKIEKITSFENLSWIDKTDILEDIIEQYIDDAKYYIIFDELDEDYRVFEDKASKNQYTYLITSLFKAVQDIKSIFKDKKNVICPIVFLRDDIYALIQDADKNKWRDFIISLNWDEDKIKKMLAFRISKSIDKNNEILSFDDAWNKLFKNELVPIGGKNKKEIPIFEYITKSTQLRPRDYIKYVQICGEKALSDRNSLISATIVKTVNEAYSNYLKDEIIDEIHAQLPDIKMILAIISQIRKWDFTIDEFKKVYLNYYRKKSVNQKNVDFVLQMLFNFSIIGNKPKRRNIFFFKYNSDAQFNFNENIIVHRGLFKALNIV
jgi:ABC-type oligopeptide transport system ATPase subunit